MEFKDMKPGLRVYVITQRNPEKRMGGRVGQLWGDGTPPPTIVRFDNGSTVRVAPEQAHVFHLEITN